MRLIEERSAQKRPPIPDSHRFNEWLSPDPDELAVQASLLRDIFGNPFRPVTLNSAVLAWNDATVVRIARGASDERYLPNGELELNRLAVLADALEEAGGQPSWRPTSAHLVPMFAAVSRSNCAWD